jgi:hypothetical protein
MIAVEPGTVDNMPDRVSAPGLDAVSPPVATGSAAPAVPLSIPATPQVVIGNLPAQVLFCWLAQGSRESTS